MPLARGGRGMSLNLQWQNNVYIKPEKGELRMEITVFFVDLFVLVVTSVLAQPDDFSKLIGPYLGQKPPEIEPAMFAPDLTSKDYENGGFVFSKGGDEVFFFSVDKKGKYALHHSKIVDGFWLKPQKIFQSNSGNDVHPFFSIDGNKIFFGSNRRIKPIEKVPYFNLWESEKNNDMWSAPKPLPSIINTGYENCGAFSSDGHFYFRRIFPGKRGEIFQSHYVNGEFKKPVKLPAEINTNYDESHPAISPDGCYLVFSSKRPGGFNKGRDELWISFKKPFGGWNKAINLGKQINNGKNTSSATITPDGKFIFFVRIDNGVGIPYWVSTKIIEELRTKLKN